MEAEARSAAARSELCAAQAKGVLASLPVKIRVAEAEAEVQRVQAEVRRAEDALMQLREALADQDRRVMLLLDEERANQTELRVLREVVHKPTRVRRVFISEVEARTSREAEAVLDSAARSLSSIPSWVTA